MQTILVASDAPTLRKEVEAVISGPDIDVRAVTSGPDRASTIVVSGFPAVAAISARTVGASLATRMVGTPRG